jgi:hypothetical protein
MSVRIQNFLKFRTKYDIIIAIHSGRLIMGLIDIFKKKEKRKEQSKCAQCLRPIAGSVYTIDSNNYCRECYNRKMAVIQQTCGQPATVTQKIPPKKSVQNKLPVAERCARCFDNIPAEQRNSGKLSDHITWKIEKSILYIHRSICRDWRNEDRL